MINIRLSSVLLFALITPPITKYWLWPDGNPYFLYALIFLGLLFYFILDLKTKGKEITGGIYRFKLATLIILLVLSLGSVMLTSIVTRHQRAPVFNVHDIVLQVEAGTRYLIEGKNPYVENYLGTPLEEFDYREMGKKVVNPALYHFVMPPFYLTFHIPFYLTSRIYPHYFDARFALVFLLGLMIFLASRLKISSENKLLFITLIALNPANLNYFIEGRSDFFVFAFLFLSWFFLSRKKLALSGVALALAVGSKQSAWLIAPFFLAYLFWEKRGKFMAVVKTLIPGIVTGLAIFLPFLLWNFEAFFESTFLYLSGGAESSYPVAGYGFGMLLYQLGAIRDLHAYYPFFIWQVLVGLPLLAVLIRWQKKENTVQKMIFCYGIFLFAFWYLSRFFNNNHLAYLSMVFISAYFWPPGQKQGVKRHHFWPASAKTSVDKVASVSRDPVDKKKGKRSEKN